MSDFLYVEKMYEINPQLDKIYWEKPLQSLANQNEGVSEPIFNNFVVFNMQNHQSVR